MVFPRGKTPVLKMDEVYLTPISLNFGITVKLLANFISGDDGIVSQLY
ncbi:MAG: hypothetical protein QNJ63_19125 [Calothrix sp. MO_192.B10]|nr:hypothetical protein [Calothrix sp. MO_192.B10]